MRALAFWRFQRAELRSSSQVVGKKNSWVEAP